MHKVTDILTLGREFAVSDKAGNMLSNVQVITFDEFIAAGVGKYTDNFESFDDYLKQSAASLTGFDSIDMSRVCWYSTGDSSPDMAVVLEYAVVNGFTCVILEIVDEELV